jgi:signal transduction histidine kinase
MLTEVDSLKAIASGRLIYTRWFFLFAGILGIGILAYLRAGTGQPLLSTDGPLLGVFFSATILNIFFLLVYNSSVRHASYRWLSILNFFQIIFDFSLALVVVILVNDPTGLLPLIFFIPIIGALFVFEPIGAMLVAVFSGLALVIVSYAPPYSLNLVDGLINIRFFGVGSGFGKFALSIFIGSYLIFIILMSFFMDIIASRGLHAVGRASRSDSVAKINSNNEALRAELIRKYNNKLDEINRTLRSREIELALANEKLEALENAKSEFISVTTHQLRTPLAAIKWTFNMILTDQLGIINSEQREFLDKGYQSTLRMISIVNSLVHIDHATAKKADYNFLRVDIVALMENIISDFTNQAQSKKISLNFVRPTNTVPLIEIDENKIRMMLQNLLDNAIKYTPINGKITITISDKNLNTAQPTLGISISDTGVGIPKAEQNKIFHKFFRASNARRQEPDGSGIGLYIARDIVDRHQGSIRFSSQEGKGTTFYIVLPLHQKSTNAV